MTIKNLERWLSSRARRQLCTTVVLHATDGASAGSSISWLRKIGLSYHYVIERDGSVTKCVPVGRVAFHAGKSLGPDGPNVNEYSIGISFANHESIGEHLTAKQIWAAEQLCKELKASMPELEHLTLHRVISPRRKKDPSQLSRVHWEAIASASGLRVWG